MSWYRLIPQKWKLSHQEGQCHVQGHINGKAWLWDSSPDNLAPESELLATVAQEKNQTLFIIRLLEVIVQWFCRRKHYFIHVNTLYCIPKFSRKQYIQTTHQCLAKYFIPDTSTLKMWGTLQGGNAAHSPASRYLLDFQALMLA